MSGRAGAEAPAQAQAQGWSESEQREARRAFSRLGRGPQFALLEESVLTRRQELLRAYPDLLGIGFGFKTKRKGARSAPELVRKPCVVFEVRRKPGFGRRVAPSRALPACLYAYALVDSQRRLCALPTDIREARDFGRLRPHSPADELPFGVAVCDGTSGTATGGTLTCAVQRVDGQLCALSCRHVLSRSLARFPDMQPKSRVRLTSASGAVVGTPTSARGPFLTFPAASFDAQLLKVSDAAALRAALSGLRFDPADPALSDHGEMPNDFYVATPRSGAAGKRVLVGVVFQGLPVLRPMPYPFPEPQGQVEIAHRLLIHAKAVGGRLEPGDSGSPAILFKSGSKLVGMYLGGDGVNAYFIPAWELFLPANYGLPSEEPWRLVAA